ncbi:MAG: glutamine--fructose-6-phosphate transaminase (isomerizing) [Candidatus Aureabacteria bacterium]|nr:glutamine--fructose-6-phosphate transaminase (isomerizing) [Candidatus Auribacterota bacterium]
MCGIVAYSGKKDCVDFLMNGLRLLEYRGYDSAGIAVVNPIGDIEIRKECGMLHMLEKSLSNGPLQGKTGIAHTRWATHGKPTQNNAHPHLSQDKKICIVHNGIIENHDVLRHELKNAGIHFISETDTEVIPHLIARYLSQGMSMKNAFMKTLSRLEGAFAIAMIAKDTPGTIYAARKGSPLIAGFKDNEVFLASDASPFITRTREVLYLDEGDVLIFNGTSSRLFNVSSGRNKKIRTTRLNIKNLSIGLGGHESYTHKEIHEQPEILKRIIRLRLGNNRNAFQMCFNDLKIPDDFFRSIDRIYITGCGTAYHAGYIGKYYFEEFMDLPVEVMLSSEFRYAKPKLNKNNLVIAISQSGETADTLASILEAKKHGSTVLSVVNVLNSSIDRESHGVVYTHAGPEIGVASTKALTSQVITLLLLSIHIAQIRKEFKRKQKNPLLKEIFHLPSKVVKVLQAEKHIRSCALKYHLATSALYLGRHLNFPVAMEGALKNKEISYMHAEGYAAGEMKHGPIALINKALPVICICTASKTYEKMISNIKEVEAREGIIISLATEGDEQVKSFSHEVIYIPETAEELSPILNVIVLQMLAYYFAKHKGNQIDKPRNLAKSVTVE